MHVLHSRTYRARYITTWGIPAFSQVHSQFVYVSITYPPPDCRRIIIYFTPFGELLPIYSKRFQLSHHIERVFVVFEIGSQTSILYARVCVLINANKLFRPPHDWRADANKCHKTPELDTEEKGNECRESIHGRFLYVSRCRLVFFLVRFVRLTRWFFPNLILSLALRTVRMNFRFYRHGKFICCYRFAYSIYSHRKQQQNRYEAGKQYFIDISSR